MARTTVFSAQTLPRDLTAGMVVFLVALPLCLGIALASNAPLFSGLLAGIVGGILVGTLSGTNTGVSGPAAGLTAIVAAQIATLGSFSTFLLALFIAGVLQLGLGIARAGFIAAFFPSSVIKGLLAAIGVILILKQFPHVLGHEADPEGDLSFHQPDHETTFSEFQQILGDMHAGAAVIGLLSIAFLMIWDKNKRLKKSIIPPQLIVVLFGVGLNALFQRWGGRWIIDAERLVKVPVADTMADFLGFMQMPDWSQWANPAVYTAAVTIAIVASLETLLNLEAVDKLDPQQRESDPSRELWAQGIGNMVLGLIGGLPMTSVIVRGSVNINAGAQTKLSAIFHGVLLLVCVMFLPSYLNLIPLSCLAAILLVTGIKLASPALVKSMWNDGRYQFVPFAVTAVAIVLTDLLVGIMIGLAVSISFILYSNLRRPIRRVVEKHVGGDVLHIELANQVSFLNRAALEKILRDVPRGGQVLLDAHQTHYIDPDVIAMIRDFRDHVAPIHDVKVSLRDFRDRYQLNDEIQFMDYSTRELQDQLAPRQVLEILRNGNERFLTGHQLPRDLRREVQATVNGQYPLAVVLSCIDSRTPAELILDVGLGDIYSVRIAANVMSSKVLGSLEFACAVAGSKLIVVMGHTQCEAVTTAINQTVSKRTGESAASCQHLGPIIQQIQQAVDPATCEQAATSATDQKPALVDQISRRNVQRVAQQVVERSATISRLVKEGRVAVVGAMYDDVTGKIEFFNEIGGPE